MKKELFKGCRKRLAWIMLVFFINVFGVSAVSLTDFKEGEETGTNGYWDNEKNGRSSINVISVYQYSNYLTIQDSNPVNTITIRVTCNDSGTTVFENVYPQGQTSFIVIPLSGWSAGSYTIELFGRENNGYLVGTFQI